jgi:phage terminase large subunit-like protein
VATKTRPKRNSSHDPTTAYAREVVAEKIVAGPSARAACKRHLKDLARQRTTEFPFYFDRHAAQRALDFFPEVLSVEADGEVVPFELLDWAVFCVGALMGWKRVDNDRRRFRKGYLEGGKGCAKTPVGAGLGLYLFIADGELSAEVYAAAGKRDQAMILFGDVVKMVDRSPRLRSRLVKSGNRVVYQLAHRASSSIFKPLSADKKKSGLRVSCGLVDELHEAQDRYTIDMLQDGFKGRKQPLLLAITNSGFDKTTICWEWHEHAVAVVDGLRVDEELFAYVMDLDPDDDPLEDRDLVELPVTTDGRQVIERVPRCWLKTNPGLGRTITVDYLRSAVSDARAIPGRENTVRRLNFCEWTDADVGWITRNAWQQVERKLVEFRKPDEVRTTKNPKGEEIRVKIKTFAGGTAIPGDFGQTEDGRADVCLGLDLSFAFDLTALAFAFPEPILGENGEPLVGADGRQLQKVAAWIEYFTPKDTAREREGIDRVPYVKWIDQGLIHGVPGSVIRLEHVANRLAEVSSEFNILWAAFDRYRHKTLPDEMAELGVEIPWIEHPQGFRRGGLLDGKHGNPLITGKDGKPVENPLWMPSSVDGLEARVIEKTLEVQLSEVTRWQVSSVVIRPDPAGTGNRVFDKRKAVGRIDGIVALAQANAAAEMRLERRSLEGFLRNPVMTP